MKGNTSSAPRRWARRLAASLATLVSVGCSEKAPSPDATASATAASSGTASAGSVVSAAPPAPPAEIDRSPVRTTFSKDRLALHSTKLDLEALDDRLTMFAADRAIAIHPLHDRMLATYTAYLGRLEGNRLVFSLVIFPPESYEFLAMGGTWPDAVMARVFFDSWASPGYQRSAPVKREELLVYDPKKDKFDDATISLGAPKLVGWRGVALVLDDGELKVAGEGAKPPARSAPRDGSRCKDTEIAAEELDALATGEVFLLGRHCGEGAYAVERWTAEGGASRIEELPEPPGGAKRGFFAAGAPDRAYAVLSTGEKVYVARWDGAAFRKVELDAEGDVKSIWTTPDGTLFFVLAQKGSTAKSTKAELWRLRWSGEVARSPAFAPSPSARVWAADADTAFVASFQSVLSTKPGLVIEGPKKEEPEKPAETASKPGSGMPPFSDGCTTPFVFLYDVSSKAPQGYDFPTTRKALSSFEKVDALTLVEHQVGSVRKLGLKVPSPVIGWAVIEHLKTAMKDEKPELVCFEPKDAARTIPIR